MGSSARSTDWQSLVDLIYTEEVDDPCALLREVFRLYRRVSNFSSAVFLPVDAATGALRPGASVDHDPELIAEYLEHYLLLDPYMINGPTPATMNRVFVFTEVAAGVPDFRGSGFPDFMRKLPYADALAVLVATSARPLGVVSVHRKAHMAAFSDRDIHDFGWLTRHLAKGLDLRERAANVGPQAGAGLLVVDAAGNILWLNGLARRIVNEARIEPRALRRLPPEGKQYRTRNGVFRARCEPLGCDSVYVRRGWVVTKKSLQQAPLHVPRKRPPTIQNPALMVSFSPESVAADQVGWLACLNLTPGEMKVARLLLQGLHYGSMAATLGLAETTVRTHVYKIYGKAGVRTRHEFMALHVALAEGPDASEAV